MSAVSLVIWASEPPPPPGPDRVNKSSENLIDLLISQHESDLKTVKEQLVRSKTQLNTLNDNDKKAFFTFLNKKKQDKFTNHLLKATRSESNKNDPANENVNLPITQKLDTPISPEQIKIKNVNTTKEEQEYLKAQEVNQIKTILLMKTLIYLLLRSLIHQSRQNK